MPKIAFNWGLPKVRMLRYRGRELGARIGKRKAQNLVRGRLDHRQILAEGGHGAYMRKTVGPGALNTIIATGPKRRLVQGSRLPMIFGAPLGDNMMTGCVGLLEALRQRKGLEPIVYI